MDEKVVYFPAKVGIFDFDVLIHKIPIPICTFDLASKQLFPAREKV